MTTLIRNATVLPMTPGARSVHPGSVLFDRDEPEADRRYKMAYITEDRRHRYASPATTVSPDGIHWRLVHTESFTLTPFGGAGPVGGAVRFGVSQMAVASDGRPLLLQAEAAGLAPLSGCRMGICHTCTRQLGTGTVRDAVTGTLTTGPDANIRICVSIPVGDVEIDL